MALISVVVLSLKFHILKCSKIISAIASFFSSTYVMQWGDFFPRKELKYPPSFDGRAVCYPTYNILLDYLAWRQVDCEYNTLRNGFESSIGLWNETLIYWCFLSVFGWAGHINNQYNTCFWMLVKSGKTKTQSQDYLKVICCHGLKKIHFLK